MSKAPAFQFYANDFMDATRLWDANAVGLYVRCLCIQWTQGSIPDDLKLLARALHCDLAEIQACWPILKRKFEAAEDGTLKNSRLEEVRGRQKEISSVRSKAAHASAIARANAKANAPANHKQRKVKEKKKGEVESGGGGGGATDVLIPVLWPAFDDFWDEYAKKVGKEAAMHEWEKVPQKDRVAIMLMLPDYVASKPDPQYRKDPERFLKHKSWNDEIIISQAYQHGTGQARSTDPVVAAQQAEDYFARKRGGGAPHASGDPNAHGPDHAAGAA